MRNDARYIDTAFLSTLPARGATLLLAFECQAKTISIHAPREGSDGRICGTGLLEINFYPRSPRGERR